MWTTPSEQCLHFQQLVFSCEHSHLILEIRLSYFGSANAHNDKFGRNVSINIISMESNIT